MRKNPSVLVRLLSTTALATAFVFAGASGVQAATTPPVPRNSEIQTAVPAAAAVGGLAQRLSIWYQDAGVIHVGLTTVSSNDLTILQKQLGPHVEVFQHSRFISAVKRTPVSASPQIDYVAVISKATTGVHADTLTPAARPPFLDGSPYWGGDRITSVQGNYVVQCTVTARYGTEMMSAGHCGPTGTVWYQGYYDGTAIQATGTMGTVATVQWGNNRIDGELLSGSSYGPYLWASTNSTNTAMPVNGGNSPTLFTSTVCTDGSFTGYTCGATVGAVNVCAAISDNGTIVNVCGLDEATNNSTVIVQSGDSGGPVLINVSPSGTDIAGTISAQSNGGHQVLFTDVALQESVFGVSP